MARAVIARWQRTKTHPVVIRSGVHLDSVDYCSPPRGRRDSGFARGRRFADRYPTLPVHLSSTFFTVARAVAIALPPSSVRFAVKEIAIRSYCPVVHRATAEHGSSISLSTVCDHFEGCLTILFDVRANGARGEKFSARFWRLLREVRGSLYINYTAAKPHRPLGKFT